MGITFSHLLAGFAGFAATFATPSYSVDSSSIRNAIVLLLSFILLGVAVVIFQRFIGEKGKQVPKRGQATESQMLHTLEQAIEEGRAGLELDVAASPVMREEIPSPPAELARQFDKALPEPKIDPESKHGQIAQSALNGAKSTNGNGFAHQPPNPARVETARVSLPRLSELRGMRFSQALRELDKAKRTAPANPGPNSLNGSLNDPLDGALNDPFNDPISETLMSAIAPFEAMFAPTASAPVTQNGATAMHESGVAATKDNGAQGRPSQQSFFPANPAPPANNRGRRREDSARSPLEPKAPEKETDGFLDQLHILPSRRGQYKKKG